MLEALRWVLRPGQEATAEAPGRAVQVVSHHKGFGFDFHETGEPTVPSSARLAL